MTSRTVPQKICDFLLERGGRFYCDACIQERLGLKWRQQVQLITATLGVTGSFERTFGQCCTCLQDKQVTRGDRMAEKSRGPSPDGADESRQSETIGR